MPLYELKFPANLMIVNNSMIQLSTFEILPSEAILNEMFFFPDADPFSLNFLQCGFETTSTMLNLGTINFIIAIHMTLLGIYILLSMCSCFRIITALKGKLSHYLIWNG